MRNNREPKKMTEIRWAVYNWGILWNTFRTRKESVAYAEDMMSKESINNQTWRDVFEVRKVRIIPVRKMAKNG